MTPEPKPTPTEVWVVPGNENDLAPQPEFHDDRPGYGVTACRLDDITQKTTDQTATCGWFRLVPRAEPPKHAPSVSAEEVYAGCQLDPPSCQIEHIEWIPTIMRQRGWVVGARLMDRWFAGKANTDKSFNPDFDSVTMKWLLGFSPPKEAYDAAIRDDVWISANARKEIVKFLKKHDKFKSHRTYFDEFGEPPEHRHEGHIQRHPFSMPKLDQLDADNWDDYVAYIARSNLYFIIGGFVEPSAKVNGNYNVTINKIGIYIRDNYDFNDDPDPLFYEPDTQPLGYWKYPGYAGRNEKKGCEDNNKIFRAWREKHGKGGDFYVYSDLNIIRTLRAIAFDKEDLK